MAPHKAADRVAKVNIVRTSENPNLKAKAAKGSPTPPAPIPARAKATVTGRNSVSIAKAASGTSVSGSRIASATSPVTARKARDIPAKPPSPASRSRNARWAHRNLLKASWK